MWTKLLLEAGGCNLMFLSLPKGARNLAGDESRVCGRPPNPSHKEVVPQNVG